MHGMPKTGFSFMRFSGVFPCYDGLLFACYFITTFC